MSLHGEDLRLTIRQIPAFSALSDLILDDLIALSRRVDFSAGERLVQQADAGDFAVVLLAGDVLVVNESRLGSEVLAEISGPALLGEIGALAGLKRTASILAGAPVSALLVDRETLLGICRHVPEIMQSVIGQLGGLIENMNRALGLYALRRWKKTNSIRQSSIRSAIRSLRFEISAPRFAGLPSTSRRNDARATR